MILGPISLIDCVAFVVFLIIQLPIRIGPIDLIKWALQTLPYLMFRMPFEVIHERYLTRRDSQSPLVQRASLFQQIVLRCVRFAFANFPSYIGQVFFSKPVSLPFVYFRMWRSGYFKNPVKWTEINTYSFNGVWFRYDESAPPDIVIYYCHGGGFAMGSTYFYFEFLVALLHLLRTSGAFANPAILSLDYTLVPRASYPVQSRQVLAGYLHALSVAGSPSRICLAGDSAGGLLLLSFLLHMADHPDYAGDKPAYACLISPWVKLQSGLHVNTSSDFLDADMLHHFGSQYAGGKIRFDDPAVSPGDCEDLDRWRRASPTKGWFVAYGTEETLAPETLKLIDRLRGVGSEVEVEDGGLIHAWPVTNFYLADSAETRIGGLVHMVKCIKRAFNATRPMNGK